MTTLKMPYEAGMDLGLGMNSATSETRGQAVTWPGAPQAVTNAGGQTIQFDIEVIDSLEDLQKALGVDVAVNASYALVSGSARVQFVDKCGFHAYSLFLYVHVDVRNSFGLIKDVTLLPAAQALLDSKDYGQFTASYGDLFINGIGTGGEAIVVFEIRTTSSSDQSDLLAGLTANAKLGPVQAGVSASFTQMASQLEASRTINYHSTTFGGANIIPDPTDPNELVSLLTQANAFPASVAGAQSVPYTMQAQDYATLGIAFPDQAELDAQRTALAEMAQLRNSRITMLNNVEYVLDNSQQFQPTHADLVAARNQLSQDVATIDAQAVTCSHDPQNCALPTLVFTGVDLPERVAALRVLTTSLPAVVCGTAYSQALQASGGRGGDSWSLGPGSAPLPIGLSLAPDGTLSGTASPQQQQPGALVFQVTDSAGLQASTTVALHLSGLEGVVSQQFHQSGSGHAQDYSQVYSLTPPAGGTLVDGTVAFAPHVVSPVASVSDGPHIGPGGVVFTLFTQAAGGFPFGHHSGEIDVSVSFTYRMP